MSRRFGEPMTWPLIAGRVYSDAVWVRIFGWGFALKPTSRSLFSERNRLVPTWTVGSMRLTLLRPRR